MTSDIRTILDFVLAERLRDICERRGVAADGSRSEQRERVVRSLGRDVQRLFPLLMRAELVEFLATRDLGGRFAFVSRASRVELERLLIMLLAGDPRVTDEQPLGAESPIRFERRAVRPKPPLVAKPSPMGSVHMSEKVFRSRVQRQRGLIYYVKDGDVWAAPARRGGSKRAPHRVHEASLTMDHVTYLYYVDGDGDVARKRRDGAALAASTSMSTDEPRPVWVFIGYARLDRRFLQELCAALSPHEGSGAISLFFDERLDPGVVWDPALKTKVQQAEIAILLLSNDFLHSRYCNEVEWPLIRERHRLGECEMMPVLIRQCYFERSPIGAHQIVRPNDRAVDDHDRHDPAWMEVMRALDKVIERVLAKRA